MITADEYTQLLLDCLEKKEARIAELKHLLQVQILAGATQ